MHIYIMLGGIWMVSQRMDKWGWLYIHRDKCPENDQVNQLRVWWKIEVTKSWGLGEISSRKMNGKKLHNIYNIDEIVGL